MKLLRAVADVQPQFVIEVDKRLRLAFVNAYTAERNGFRVADVKGLRVADVWSDSTGWEVTERVMATGVAETTVEFATMKNGERIWFSCTRSRLPNRHVWSQSVDITEHIRAEQRLALSRRMEGGQRSMSINPTLASAVQQGAIDLPGLVELTGLHPVAVVRQLGAIVSEPYMLKRAVNAARSA